MWGPRSRDHAELMRPFPNTVPKQWRIQDFPRGGGAPTPEVGVRTYFFGRKLHENERILAPGGGARPWRPPLDPPLQRSI